MTTKEARMLREVAEAEILVALKKLSKSSGLDIASVNVMLIVNAADDGDPRREAESVRIDMCV